MAKKKLNKVIKGLQKASKTHAKQAKTLQSIKMVEGGLVKRKKRMTTEEKKKLQEQEKKIAEARKATLERKILGKKPSKPSGRSKKRLKKFSSGGLATRGLGAVIK